MGDYLTDVVFCVQCFDAKQYGALMLVDPEEEYSESEVKKLRDDVVNEGLGVFVVGDWYNVKQMEGEF